MSWNARDCEIQEIFRYSTLGPEQLDPPLMWALLGARGWDQWPPVMPPNPDYSESGSWSAPWPLESQEVLVWLPRQPWDMGAVPLGKPRMKSSVWKVYGSSAVPAPSTGVCCASGAARQTSLLCSLLQDFEEIICKSSCKLWGCWEAVLTPDKPLLFCSKNSLYLLILCKVTPVWMCLIL